MEQQIIFLAALIFVLFFAIDVIYVIVMVLIKIVLDIRWKIEKRRLEKIKRERERNRAHINEILIKDQIKECYEKLEDCDKKADELFK